MAHEIAKLLLEHADTFLKRGEAIQTALDLGMSLQQIEEYLDMHSHALFRHGVCPECAQNLLDEVELELGEKVSDDIVVEKGNGRK